MSMSCKCPTARVHRPQFPCNIVCFLLWGNLSKPRLHGGKESTVCSPCEMRRVSGDFLAFPNPIGTLLSKAAVPAPNHRLSSICCYAGDRVLPGNRIWKNLQGRGVLNMLFTQKPSCPKSLSVFRLHATPRLLRSQFWKRPLQLQQSCS